MNAKTNAHTDPDEIHMLMRRGRRADAFAANIRDYAPATLFAVNFKDGTDAIAGVAEIMDDRTRPAPSQSVNMPCHWYELTGYVGSGMAHVTYRAGVAVGFCDIDRRMLVEDTRPTPARAERAKKIRRAIHDANLR